MTISVTEFPTDVYICWLLFLSPASCCSGSDSSEVRLVRSRSAPWGRAPASLPGVYCSDYSHKLINRNCDNAWQCDTRFCNENRRVRRTTKEDGLYKWYLNHILLMNNDIMTWHQKMFILILNIWRIPRIQIHHIQKVYYCMKRKKVFFWKMN